MGFLDNISAKAEASLQKIKNDKEDKIKNEVAEILLENEEIKHILSINEDYSVFTNLRILIVDKSLVSSKKSIISIYYNKISLFGIRKGGTFSLSQEIEIMVGSHSYEIKTYDIEESKLVFKLISQQLNK